MRTPDQLLTDTTPSTVADLDYRRVVRRGAWRRRVKRGLTTATVVAAVAVTVVAYPASRVGVEIEPARPGTTATAPAGVEDPPTFVASTDDLALFKQYQQAMYDYRDCMQQHGTALGWFTFDPQRGLYDSGYPADQTRAHQTCFPHSTQQLDQAWQARANDLSGYTAAKLDRLRRCLDDHGIAYNADDTAGALGVHLANAGINRFTDCPD